jgi:hypothetical protein
MDVLNQVLGTAGSAAAITAVGTVVILVLRELLVWLLSVWAMATSKKEKEQLATVFVCLLAPRRGEKVRERLAAAKAQIPRPRKPKAGVEATDTAVADTAPKSLTSS